MNCHLFSLLLWLYSLFHDFHLSLILTVNIVYFPAFLKYFNIQLFVIYFWLKRFLWRAHLFFFFIVCFEFLYLFHFMGPVKEFFLKNQLILQNSFSFTNHLYYLSFLWFSFISLLSARFFFSKLIFQIHPSYFLLNIFKFWVFYHLGYVPWLTYTSLES